MSYTAQELNRKIAFVEYGYVLDSNGEPVRGDQGEFFYEWTTVAEVFAKVEPLVGREYLAAAAIQSEDLVKFTMRYRSGLTTAMKIAFDGQQYDIQSIQNIRSANRETLIYAKATV